jgi:hypothetical protein
VKKMQRAFKGLRESLPSLENPSAGNGAAFSLGLSEITLLIVLAFLLTSVAYSRTLAAARHAYTVAAALTAPAPALSEVAACFSVFEDAARGFIASSGDTDLLVAALSAPQCTDDDFFADVAYDMSADAITFPLPTDPGVIDLLSAAIDEFTNARLYYSIALRLAAAGFGITDSLPDYLISELASFTWDADLIAVSPRYALSILADTLPTIWFSTDEVDMSDALTDEQRLDISRVVLVSPMLRLSVQGAWDNLTSAEARLASGGLHIPSHRVRTPRFYFSVTLTLAILTCLLVLYLTAALLEKDSPHLFIETIRALSERDEQVLKTLKFPRHLTDASAEYVAALDPLLRKSRRFLGRRDILYWVAAALCASATFIAVGSGLAASQATTSLARASMFSSIPQLLFESWSASRFRSDDALQAALVDGQLDLQTLVEDYFSLLCVDGVACSSLSVTAAPPLQASVLAEATALSALSYAEDSWGLRQLLAPGVDVDLVQSIVDLAQDMYPQVYVLEAFSNIAVSILSNGDAAFEAMRDAAIGEWTYNAATAPCPSSVGCPVLAATGWTEHYTTTDADRSVSDEVKVLRASDTVASPRHQAYAALLADTVTSACAATHEASLDVVVRGLGFIAHMQLLLLLLFALVVAPAMLLALLSSRAVSRIPLTLRRAAICHFPVSMPCLDSVARRLYLATALMTATGACIFLVCFHFATSNVAIAHRVNTAGEAEVLALYARTTGNLLLDATSPSAQAKHAATLSGYATRLDTLLDSFVASESGVGAPGDSMRSFSHFALAYSRYFPPPDTVTELIFDEACLALDSADCTANGGAVVATSLRNGLGAFVGAVSDLADAVIEGGQDMTANIAAAHAAMEAAHFAIDGGLRAQTAYYANAGRHYFDTTALFSIWGLFVVSMLLLGINYLSLVRPLFKQLSKEVAHTRDMLTLVPEEALAANPIVHEFVDSGL